MLREHGHQTSAIARQSGRRFAEMFPHVAMDRGGFASAEEFLATVHSGLADSRLVHAYQMGATATGAVPSEGGFSVPTQMFSQWLDSSLESEIVRSRADVRPMTSDSAVAPGWDGQDHTSNLYGGFSGEWLTEIGDMTAQTAKLRLIALKARKLGLLARVSNELLADGMSFEQQLSVAITKALGWFVTATASLFLSRSGAL
jgi:HK97 family phage major capsid protein